MHGAAARLWQVVAHVVDLSDASNLRREHLPCRGMLRCCARVLRVQAAFSACPQPWNCGGVARIKSSEGCSRCALQSLNDLVGGGQAGGASCAWCLSFFCCELQQKDHKVTLIVRLPSRRAFGLGVDVRGCLGSPPVLFSLIWRLVVQSVHLRASLNPCSFWEPCNTPSCIHAYFLHLSGTKLHWCAVCWSRSGGCAVDGVGFEPSGECCASPYC